MKNNKIYRTAAALVFAFAATSSAQASDYSKIAGYFMSGKGSSVVGSAIALRECKSKRLSGDFSAADKSRCAGHVRKIINHFESNGKSDLAAAIRRLSR